MQQMTRWLTDSDSEIQLCDERERTAFAAMSSKIFWVIFPRPSLDDFVMCAAVQVILRERVRPNEVFQVSLATAQPRASSRTSGFGTTRYSADSTVAGDAVPIRPDVNSSCLGFCAR